MSMEESNKVRVKDEPIFYNQSISQTKKDTCKKVKKEPIENEMQTPKSQIESNSEEVEVKAEEKFSATEEFANKTSIAFLNEETTSDNNPINNQATTINKTRNRKTNKLQKSK